MKNQKEMKFLDISSNLQFTNTPVNPEQLLNFYSGAGFERWKITLVKNIFFLLSVFHS